MKFLKDSSRITLKIISYVILLNIVHISIFAHNEENIQETKDKIIYTYSIQQQEEQDFLNSLEKEITKDEITAKLIDTQKSGGDKISTTERSYENSITLNTNDTESILSAIAQTYQYSSEDGYSGELQLDTNSIKITENKGARHEYKVSITRSYNDYGRNDLDTIPKTIISNGITYYLTSPNWEITSYETIDNQQVPLTYSGNMIYEGITYRTDPSTYTINYKYTGFVEKTETHPLEYVVTYQKEIKERNIIPAILGSSGILFIGIVLFFSKKRITVYAKESNTYKQIGKARIINKKINLNKFSHYTNTKNYKIELDNKLYNKIKNQTITLQLNGVIKTKTITSESFEVGF